MHDAHYIPDQIEICKFSSMHLTDLAFEVYFDNILKYSTVPEINVININGAHAYKPKSYFRIRRSLGLF